MGLVKRVLLFLLVTCTKFGYLSCEEGVFKDVKIRCYSGGKNTTHNEYDLSESLKLYQKLDDNPKTIFYIHGWRETVDGASTAMKIVDSFLQRKGHNVCVLNYEKLAETFYPIIVGDIPQLGEKVAFVIHNWIKNGFDYSRIHCIGFSLGAHVCGEIGRNIQRKGYRLPRITGLDPANPFFCNGDSKPFPNALNKNDADFVDIIHTDGGFLGCKVSLGHVDFYPNRGMRPQPMCGDAFMQFAKLVVGDNCAHAASAIFYAKSVTAEKIIYLATNRLNKKLTAQMGYNCPTSAFGDYDLEATVN